MSEIENNIFSIGENDERMVLRTEDLVKKYRQRTVVNHVSIDSLPRRKPVKWNLSEIPRRAT